MSTSPGRPPKIGLRTTAPPRPHGGAGMSSPSVRRQRGGVPPDCPCLVLGVCRAVPGGAGILKTSWAPGCGEGGPARHSRLAGGDPAPWTPRRTLPPPGKAPEAVSVAVTALTPPLPPKTPGRGKRERAAAAAGPGRVGSRRSGRLQGLETCTPAPAATRKQSARK